MLMLKKYCGTVVTSPFEHTPLPPMLPLVTILGYPLVPSPGDVLFERILTCINYCNDVHPDKLLK